jgi:predicted dehydrogenase
MQFALLGDHADGLAFVRALVETGRHDLAVYSGPAVGLEYLKAWAIQPKVIHDLEEILADPQVEGIVIASHLTFRPAHLRRALQSDRHVVCVHPADPKPDLAYEAGMIQADTKKKLFPLLPEAVHPVFAKLAERIEPGEVQMAFMVFRSAENSLEESNHPDEEPWLPGWEVLRRMGGEIQEVFGLAKDGEITSDKPLLVIGQFSAGGLFQSTFLPKQPDHYFSLQLITNRGTAFVEFKEGYPGLCRLNWLDESGQVQEESWPAWNPWPALVQDFETSLDQAGSRKNLVTWQDEIRCLELDLAVRRSVLRGRSSTLEYQEATEEAGFKGTMTLVGCGLLWLSLVLLFTSVWIPQVGWAIIPVFGIFLILQLLRWVLPPSENHVKTPSQSDLEA